MGPNYGYERIFCESCGRRCFKYNPKQTACGRCRKKQHRSIYVYGWYHPGAYLPHYIGKGTGGRAWRKGSVGVKIYRDQLTDEGAKLVEAVLINLFGEMGAPLKNLKAGMSRQERPPLETN